MQQPPNSSDPSSIPQLAEMTQFAQLAGVDMTTDELARMRDEIKTTLATDEQKRLKKYAATLRWRRKNKDRYNEYQRRYQLEYRKLRVQSRATPRETPQQPTDTQNLCP